MVRRFTFLFLLFALAKFSFPQAAWEYIGTIPGNPDINSIAVVSADVLFGVTGNSGVYRTLDGGASGELRNTGITAGGTCYCVSASDSLNAVVGWLNAAGTSASIYRTTNGGASWTSVWTLAKSFPDGLKMFTSTYGIFIGDPTGNGQPYQFRYTKDGGATWLLSPTSPIATNEFGVINAFDFIDTNRIWVGSANTVATGTTAKIYKTTTGINGTWSYATVSGTASSLGLYYQALAFVNPENGMAGSNTGNIVKTTDGGITWSAVTIPSDLTIFSVLNMAGLKDGSNTIWMSVIIDVGFYGVYKTTDFGTTWTSITLPAEITTQGFQHMQFLSPTLGYAGGTGGAMFRYSGQVPVELTSFTANATIGKVTLNWRTATELNNRGFEIQRKVDDNEWLVIAFRNGNGTTTIANNYSYVDNVSELSASKISYRLKQVDFDGNVQFSSIVLVDNPIPVKYSVSQNFPNPFNPSTLIQYQVPENVFVSLKVYNSLGQEAAVLVNGMVNAGTHEVQFNASNLSSGIYYYVIKAGEKLFQTKKMMLLK